MSPSELFALYTEATKTNPVIAGLVGLWVMGLTTYLLRTVPQRLWRLLSLQCSTAVTFNTTGIWESRVVFVAFSEWYGGTKWANQSRRLSLDAIPNTDHGPSDETRVAKVVLGPGYGLHFFFADGWLFWFRKSVLDSSGSEAQKEQIELFCFGRDKRRIERVVERFKPKPPAANGIAIYTFADRWWARAATIPKRPLDSVIVAPWTFERITKQLHEFKERRDWYQANGLAHKLTILLHGVPGCGKTSLIKALASHYGSDIYTLNINELTDKSLACAIASTPKGAFLLLEDFDSALAVKARADKSQRRTQADAIDDAAANFVGLSLTGVLNALDGIVPLDNNVVFLTTNHLDAIDAAVLRKGRTDLIVEIGPLGPAEVTAYVKHVYGRTPDQTFPPIPGCDIQALVLEHKTDYEGFIRGLARAGGSERSHLEVVQTSGENHGASTEA